MEPFLSKFKSFPLLLFVFLVLTMMSVYFLLSNPEPNELFERVKESKANTDFTKRSMVFKDEVVLLKDKGVTINNSRLVFTGFEDEVIHLDLFLLELDPQYAYHQTLSKVSAKEGVRLGDSEFRLLSVNKKKLNLKINTLYTAK